MFPLQIKGGGVYIQYVYNIHTRTFYTINIFIYDSFTTGVVNRKTYTVKQCHLHNVYIICLKFILPWWLHGKTSYTVSSFHFRMLHWMIKTLLQYYISFKTTCYMRYKQHISCIFKKQKQIEQSFKWVDIWCPDGNKGWTITW